MQADEYRRLFDLEDRYWWFVARRRLAIGLLRDSVRGSNPIICDLGCGTGAVLKEISAWSRPIGLDMSPLALGFCRERGLNELVQADGIQLPIASGTIDAMVALDVFEHIDRDDLAFAEAYRILKPGGVLVLSVPAFQTLWSPHDVALMHMRRYRLGQVRKRLVEAGFTVEKTSYSIFFLFPIVALTRICEKFKRGDAKASLPSLPGWFNRFLVRLQDTEAGLLKRVRLPWGTSVVAVARKR